MHIIRKNRRNSLIFYLLVMTMVMRSLLAPGLIVTPDDGGLLGFGVNFCDGFERVDPNDFLVGNSHGDNHDTGHVDSLAVHSHSDTIPHDHKDDAGHGLSGDGCGLWYASTFYVQTVALHLEHFQQFGPDRFQIEDYIPISNAVWQNPQQPRAPPLFLVI